LKISKRNLSSSTDDEEESRNHRRYSPDNLERDYWDIVDSHSRHVVVEYGNDVNTDEFGSGFPLSERGRSVYGKVDPAKIGAPEPKFGTDDYYKETWWNLNNMPQAPDSVLRHVKVGSKFKLVSSLVPYCYIFLVACY
jgi:histone demethylase JARID1